MRGELLLILLDIRVIKLVAVIRLHKHRVLLLSALLGFTEASSIFKSSFERVGILTMMFVVALPIKILVVVVAAMIKILMAAASIKTPTPSFSSCDELSVSLSVIKNRNY